MKKTLQLISICAFGAMLASPVFAKTSSLAPELAVQDQCTPENKNAWYTEFRDKFKKEPAKAYELAKKYLACPAEAGDEQITAYLKKWMAAYDKEARKIKLPQLLNEKKYTEAYALGKEILADEPENARVLIDLGYGGYLAAASQNETFNADAIAYAKKAIQLIESGKAPESWAPFKTKDETLAYLYYTIGFLSLKSNPSEAIGPLIKSAQLESDIKKNPSTYYFIAVAYEAGPYAKMSEEYNRLYKDKPETPESKLAQENINQIVDRAIDAYARAVALSTAADPKTQQNKKEWLDRLTELYKYRHGKSDAGLNEMIAGILSKPLPPEPTPLTSLPTAPAATTPTSGSAATSTSASDNQPGVAPIAAVPAPQPGKAEAVGPNKAGTAAVGTAKTNSPTKPRKRSNHRRRPTRG
jgi:hypothetical protein